MAGKLVSGAKETGDNVNDDVEDNDNDSDASTIVYQPVTEDISVDENMDVGGLLSD